MNIKKQIRNLYIYEVISGFQIVDLIWVYFLLQRGFSLAAAGVAEGTFHVVGMCCEIPSGMIADLIGRRKTLILSGLMSALAAWAMICTEYFPVILVAMGLNAVSYNLVSGTREALTYDSLLEVGQEEKYLEVSARQESIYSGLNAVTGLIAVLVIGLGYKKAYMLAILKGLLSAAVAAGLTETRSVRRNKREALTLATICFALKEHFQKSITSLKEHETMRRKMLLDGILGTGCYMVIMIQQAHLPELGLPDRLIGIPLFLLALAEIAGAMAAERTAKLTVSKAAPWLGLAMGFGIWLSGSNSLAVAVCAAVTAGGIRSFASVKIGNENQKEFSSEIRATMVSVGSMVYSISMTAASPAVGYLAEHLGAAGGLGCMGAAVAASSVYLAKKMKNNKKTLV